MKSLKRTASVLLLAVMGLSGCVPSVQAVFEAADGPVESVYAFKKVYDFTLTELIEAKDNSSLSGTALVKAQDAVARTGPVVLSSIDVAIAYESAQDAYHAALQALDAGEDVDADAAALALANAEVALTVALSDLSRAITDLINAVQGESTVSYGEISELLPPYFYEVSYGF